MASVTLRYNLYQSVSDFNYTFRYLEHTHPKHAQYRERTYISMADEIACLISLATGRRTIGDHNITRRFDQSDDPLGDPRDPGPRPEIRSEKRRSILPYYFSRERDPLSMVEPVLRQYFDLPVDQAAKFLRAAILYKKALLQSDVEADLSWIWSVGAIETLAEVPGEHDGVLNRFVSFLLAHLPPPPPTRPPQLQLDWGPSLKRAFEQVYGYRSDFLHAGHPFPSPMTHPPENFSPRQGDSWFTERPIGGKGFGGTMYEYDSSPMELHVFVHIVQGALLKWLELRSKDEVLPEPPALPEPPQLQVEVTRAVANRLRIVVTEENGDVVKDEKIASADLIPPPLKEVLPPGYEVSGIVLSKALTADPGDPNDQPDKDSQGKDAPLVTPPEVSS